jgi:glycosyltransferase involved in cell wall biosynthesis
VIRIVNVISGLQTGGAELAMARLAGALDPARFEVSVVALGPDGPVRDVLRGKGIEVTTLGLRTGRPSPWAVARLGRSVRGPRPTVVQTWLYHADLVGGVTASMLRAGPVVWNIRQSSPDPATYSRHAIWAAKTCARLSRVVPARIVSVSQAAVDAHVAFGYDRSRFRVIHNGIDAEVFGPPSIEERAAIREEMGIRADALVIGLVARRHAVKDHPTFLSALRRVVDVDPRAQALLVGAGTETLADDIRSVGLSDHCQVLGHRTDIVRITQGLDVAVSSSVDEGLPNSIGEAMACGVPCVVTDVGDSAHLVADTGAVVRPRDPRALATALVEMLARSPADRGALGVRARERVQQSFGMPKMIAAYEDLYTEVTSSVRH